jgi:hypothetical protein
MEIYLHFNQTGHHDIGTFSNNFSLEYNQAKRTGAIQEVHRRK